MQAEAAALEKDIYHRLYGQHSGSDGFGSRLEWHFWQFRAVNMSCQSFFAIVFEDVCWDSAAKRLGVC